MYQLTSHSMYQLTSHAVQRFAERTGFGVHRIDAAHEELARVLRRARVRRDFFDKKPCREIADKKHGVLLLGIEYCQTGIIVCTVKLPESPEKHRRSPQHRIYKRQNWRKEFVTGDF